MCCQIHHCHNSIHLALWILTPTCGNLLLTVRLLTGWSIAVAGYSVTVRNLFCRWIFGATYPLFVKWHVVLNYGVNYCWGITVELLRNPTMWPTMVTLYLGCLVSPPCLFEWTSLYLFYSFISLCSCILNIYDSMSPFYFVCMVLRECRFHEIPKQVK